MARAQACDLLVGTGTPGVELTFVIMPCSFSAAEATRFNMLSDYVADAFSSNIADVPDIYVKDAIEPYASNQDKFSVWRANDFSGAGITEGNCWSNKGSLIAAAGTACGFIDAKIIAIANNSGESGGNPAGNFSVVGSGTPSLCDVATCTNPSCPPGPGPPYSCSWDYGIKFTALHETGHTVYGLRHTDTDPGAAIGDPSSAGPNCSGDPVCTEWSGPAFTSWILPGDPPFGCFAECDKKDNWRRPWETFTNIP